VEKVIRSNDIEVQIGRASGGRTFIRVVHHPTNASRYLAGLGTRSVKDVRDELMADLQTELLRLGWIPEGKR
jgi:hypothetical protein